MKLENFTMYGRKLSEFLLPDQIELLEAHINQMQRNESKAIDHFPDTGNMITIQAEKITVFHSFIEWVNKAQSRIGGFRKDQEIICIDKNGNGCTIGLDFMVARDNDIFPVTAYRLIRTSEIHSRKEAGK